MPLTDVQIRKIKASGDDYQITDGNALYLVIRKKGTKTWRAKRRAKLSRFLGKRALKSFHPRLFNARIWTPPVL